MTTPAPHPGTLIFRCTFYALLISLVLGACFNTGTGDAAFELIIYVVGGTICGFILGVTLAFLFAFSRPRKRKSYAEVTGKAPKEQNPAITVIIIIGVAIFFLRLLMIFAGIG